MHLRSSFRRLTLPLFLFLAGAPALIHAQELDFDVSVPIDTTESQLSAKGVTYAPITDAAIQERLSGLSGCLQLRTSAVVRSYVRHYVQIKTEKTKIMLGKRLTYFPLFEQKLREQGMPSDLKYLSVVESALNPKAISRVGATGLWQFMPSTGSDYGLRTNSAVEERSDPVKSTDAAIRYLKDLYTQFDDWALALAAYNSGPTRVNSAIRRARSRSFWSIQRYLPEETRNYVPAFIAATYICNFYSLHGIDPYEPDLDQQLTAYLKVYEGMSFRDISDATGIDYGTVKALNPGFNRGYVPPSANGNYVVLPQRVMPSFVRYLNTLGVRNYTLDTGTDYASGESGDGRYWKGVISAEKSEHLEELASRYGYCSDHLKCWNGLSSNYVTAGQTLALWYPVFVQKHQKVKISAPVQASGPAIKQEINTGVVAGKQQAMMLSTPVRRESPPQPLGPRFHTVRRNESLEDIARQYGTSVETLRQLNKTEVIQTGARIRVALPRE